MGGNSTKILDRLYQGGSTQLIKEDFYEARGITHVVSLGFRGPPKKMIEQFSLKTLHFKKGDLPSSDLREHFEETTHFIHEARMSGGTVLVHCHAGISRSSTITLAYLMAWLELPFQPSLSILQVRRSEASPNSGFRRQLRLYEKSEVHANLVRDLKTTNGWRERLQSDISEIIGHLELYLKEHARTDLQKSHVHEIIKYLPQKHASMPACEEQKSDGASSLIFPNTSDVADSANESSDAGSTDDDPLSLHEPYSADGETPTAGGFLAMRNQDIIAQSFSQGNAFYSA